MINAPGGRIAMAAASSVSRPPPHAASCRLMPPHAASCRRAPPHAAPPLLRAHAPPPRLRRRARRRRSRMHLYRFGPSREGRRSISNKKKNQHSQGVLDRGGRRQGGLARAAPSGTRRDIFSAARHRRNCAMSPDSYPPRGTSVTSLPARRWLFRRESGRSRRRR